MKSRVGSAAALLFLLAVPAFAQHLGSRQQWQPEKTVGGWGPDRRLYKQVTASILGRSAIYTLAELSKQTGVALKVAPENVATLGERKLAIFVRTLELKDVMVQIPEVLQECHWDIDESGKAPVYYLHWNVVSDPTDPEQQAAQLRAQRAARLDEIRRVLAMTPEERKEFEKEDLYLARAMSRPDNRHEAEIFLMLPPDQLQRLNNTGRLQMKYSETPEAIRQRVEEFIRRFTTDPNLDKGFPGYKEQPSYADYREQVKRWRSNPDALIDFFNNGDTLGFGIMGKDLGHYAIPILQRYPALPEEGTMGGDLYTLLETEPRVELTPPKYNASPQEFAEYSKRAQQAEMDRWAKVRRQGEQWLEKDRLEKLGSWETQQDKATEPNDSQLRRQVALLSGRAELAELQRELARQSSLNFVADFFTEPPITVSQGLVAPQPLWRMLNALGAERNCAWRKRGSLIVIRHDGWQKLKDGEIPDSLIQEHRKKLKRQGHFTIADVANFFAALHARGLGGRVPQDFQDAGLMYSSRILLVYASLTPEQAAAAHKAPGLPVSSLPEKQQQQLIEDCRFYANFSRATPVEVADRVRRGYYLVTEEFNKPNWRGPANVVRLSVELSPADKRDFPKWQAFTTEVLREVGTAAKTVGR